MAKNKAQLISDVQKIQSIADVNERQPLIDQFAIDTDEYLKSQNIPENHPLVKGLYEGLENLSVLGKPAAHILTPISEVARAGVREIGTMAGNTDWDTPSIDPLAEWKTKDLKPSDRAGFSNLMRDITVAAGGKNEPLVNISSKDYPKAAEFAKNLTVPANIAGIGADVMAGKTIADVTPDVVYKKGVSLDAAKSYIRSIAKDKALLSDLEKSGKINEIAEMVANNPEKYMHQFKPNAMYEQLMGPIEQYTDPDTGKIGWRRSQSQGDINRLLNEQSKIVDKIPTSHYSADRIELQKQALSELKKNKRLTADQMLSAENIIKKEIPVLEPSQEKIDRIKKLGELSSKYKDIRDSVPDNIPNPNYREDLQWLSKLESVEPNFKKQIQNPAYREDLQWLSKLPVVEGDTFPKNYSLNETHINTPDFDPYKLNSYIDESKINLTKGTYSTMSEIPKDQGGFKNKKILDIIEGKQKEPRFIDKPDDKFTTTQKRVDIALGKQKEPATIPNQQKIAQLAEIEQQMADLGVHDPHGSSIESYFDLIRERNQEPSGFTSTLRQTGNRLMTPPVPGENVTDLASKQIAGRVLSDVGAKNQAIAMSGMPQSEINDYNYINDKLSKTLNLRDLGEGNLVSRDYASPPTQSLGGKTGIIGTIEKGYGRHIRPTASELSRDIGNNAKAATKHIMNTQPLINPYSTIAMQKGLVENLADYQIPRDSNEILSNPKLAIAKVAQVTNNPKIVNMLSEALTDHPEKLETVLPVLVMQYPNLFESDIYNRVNGKILDPMVRQKAYQDVNNSGLSNTEKAILKDGLNRDGSLPKDKFK